MSKTGWLIRVRLRNDMDPDLQALYVNSQRVVTARRYTHGWQVDLDNGETWLVHEDSAPDME